nr:hypothetical protein [uncultured Acetatifactor sp.]
MKKSAWAALSIMILSLIVLPFAGRKVNGEREGIVITQEILSGDPAAAEGITLELATHWNGHLLWNTEYTIGSGEQAKSSFTFSSEEVRWNRMERKRAYVHHLAGAGYGSAATYTGAAVNPEDFPMSEIIQAAAGRTNPGETHMEMVRIGDYAELYPLDFGMEGGSVEYGGDYNENVRYLTELFHISTGEDHVEITTEKNGEGTLTAVSSRMASDEEALRFAIAGTSAFGEAGCYYAYECESSADGRVADRGQNSGIFYQPFERGDGWVSVDVTRMRKVCGIPEQTIPEGMLLDQENGRLYLEVRGEEEYRLCIYRLDGENLILTQDIPIRRNDILTEDAAAGEKIMWNENIEDYSARPVLRQIQKEGDNLLITWSDNGFAFVVSRAQEDGRYDLWCSGTFPDYLEQDLKMVGEKPFPEGNGCVFDGERLVLAAFEDWMSVNALVAVYGEAGEIYTGLYRHSGATDMDESDFQLYEHRILPQGQANWRYFWDGYLGELYREGSDTPVRPLKIS